MKEKAVIILICHFFVGVLLIIPTPLKKSKQIHRLKVTTIVTSPTKSSVALAEKKVIKKVSAPQKTLPTPVAEKKKISPSSTPVPKPKKPSPQQTLDNTKILELTKNSLTQIKEMENKLIEEKTKNISTLHEKLSTTTTAPTYSKNEEMAYAEQLVLFLKNCITLPSLGDSVISLTIAPDGQLLSFSFELSENPENEAYLRKNLPQLRFPLQKSLSKTNSATKVKIRLVGENLIANS